CLLDPAGPRAYRPAPKSRGSVGMKVKILALMAALAVLGACSDNTANTGAATGTGGAGVGTAGGAVPGSQDDLVANVGDRVFFAFALPARAQMDSREGIMLQNQILELRRDLNALQNQRSLPPPAVYGGRQSAGGEIAPELLNRVLQLEEEVRRLRGQVDEQA